MYVCMYVMKMEWGKRREEKRRGEPYDCNSIFFFEINEIRKEGYNYNEGDNRIE
mgnify:CR=1